MARSSLICCFLLLTGLVVAQDNRPPDPNNHFIYPPLPGPQLSNDPTVFKDNINFTVGIAQSAPFKWVTNMTSMRVTLNQEGNPESVNAVDISPCSGTDFVYWDGSLGDIDLANGSVAYLAAWNCSQQGTPVFFSHYINLTTSSATSTSSSTSTRSPTFSSSINTASPNEPTTPPNTTPTPAPSKSNGAAIGGGVGGGIGGLCLLILVASLIYLRRRKKQQRKQDGNADTHVMVRAR